MIILVISIHAADTYSPLGNWYLEDRQPLSLRFRWTGKAYCLGADGRLKTVNLQAPR